MTQKEIAHQFLKMAASGNVQAAYDSYVSHQFKHHNQYFKGDRNSLLEAMQASHKQSPNKSFTIKHTYEDKDTVIVHSLVERANGNDFHIAVAHILKFKDNKIIELWDLGQQIINNSPNENGLF